MNDKKLFESGCFSPEWATDMEQSPISTFYTRQNKDLQTLLNELDEIKTGYKKFKPNNGIWLN